MVLSEALLPEFDQKIASTRRTLKRVPEDKFSMNDIPIPAGYGPSADEGGM